MGWKECDEFLLWKWKKCGEMRRGQCSRHLAAVQISIDIFTNTLTSPFYISSPIPINRSSSHLLPDCNFSYVIHSGFYNLV
ncbi:unnamed protein product [Lactuca virosa]|uniref:Uncharacterized protein n=1 Tax=Lactuca virosa TaxID=75947 RepID=A0AAU9NJV7_9ASTR|nr:unnamed protein product [Lactuca virosa]